MSACVYTSRYRQGAIRQNTIEISLPLRTIAHSDWSMESTHGNKGALPDPELLVS